MSTTTISFTANSPQDLLTPTLNLPLFPEMLILLFVGVALTRTKRYSMPFLIGTIVSAILFGIYQNTNVGVRVLTDTILLFTMWILAFSYEYWKFKKRS